MEKRLAEEEEEEEAERKQKRRWAVVASPEAEVGLGGERSVSKVGERERRMSEFWERSSGRVEHASGGFIYLFIFKYKK
jgi:hypothetical protein